MLKRRCDRCHLEEKWLGAFELSWAVSKDENGRAVSHGIWPIMDPVGSPRWEALINLDKPEKSLLVRAPLAKEAGGPGWCRQSKASSARYWYEPPPPGARPAVVFRDKSDPDYQAIAASLKRASEYFHTKVKRFDLPGFEPNPNLLKNLIRFGVLPQGYDPVRDGSNVRPERPEGAGRRKTKAEVRARNAAGTVLGGRLLGQMHATNRFSPLPNSPWWRIPSRVFWTVPISWRPIGRESTVSTDPQERTSKKRHVYRALWETR